MKKREIIEIVNELRNYSTEEEWFEFKENQYNEKGIGEYISSLSNSAAMDGYKTINNQSTGGSTMTTKYIIVIDPMDRSEKAVLWNANNIFGYMRIFIG